MKVRLFLVAVATAIVVPAASSFADNQPTTAAALLASAPVAYDGTNWGPVPLWTIDLRPTLNETIDVAADSAADARTDPGVVSEVTSDLKSAGLLVQDPPPQQQTTTTTPATTTTVTTNVAAAQAPSAPSVTTTTTAQVAATPAPALVVSPTVVAPPTQVATLDSTPAIVGLPTTLTILPTLNPALAATVSKALGKKVSITKATVCLLSAKVVPCVRLYSVLKTSHRRMTIRAAGKVAKRISVV